MTHRPPPPADLLATLLEFETLVSDTSASLILAAPEQCDREVLAALDAVRRHLDAERCGLLRVDVSRRVAIAEQVSAGPGVPDVPSVLNLAELFPWAWQRLVVERLPIRLSRMDDLPPEGAMDRPAWLQLGIRSTLSIPIETRGEVRHIIVVQTIHRERDWPDVVVTRLRLLGEMLVSALDRSALFRDLRMTEARMQVAADAAGAGLWEFDPATGRFWATARARELAGFSPDEPITVDRLMARIHPEDRRLIQAALTGPNPATVEYRVILADGRVRWLSSTGRPVLGPTGEAESLSGATLDVTARKAAAEALARSEGRLASGAELAGFGSYEVDFGERVAYADSRAREILGVPEDRVAGLGLLEFWVENLHPADRPRVLEARERLHRGATAQIGAEYRFMNPVHGERWIHHLALVSRRDAAGRAICAYGVFRDVTDARRAEEERIDLGRRLIRAQEEERATIARELHDDFTQRLAVLAIEAGRAEIEAGDEARAAPLRALREGLSRLSEDVHALAYQLHSSVLEELGLEEALRTACEWVGRLDRLVVSSDICPTDGGLGKDEALCLFRVAQEALHNVVRHSAAHTASVGLRKVNGGFLLAIRDDGVGFDPASAARQRTLGLAGMGERTRLVNGTLELDSAPGKGTAVLAWVPAQEAPP